MNPRDSIRRRGGLAATFELHADGFDRRAITRLVAAGVIVRIRQGWYAEHGLHSELARAVRVGGRATCSTALRSYGVWAHADSTLHVCVHPGACQLRNSRNKSRRLSSDRTRVTVHWSDSSPATRSRLRVDPIDALRDLARCASAELVGASAESALHQRLISAAQAHSLSVGARSDLAEVLRHVTGVCESGTEFLTRWRLREELTVPLRPQVRIAEVGWVDFVLGERLVIEVDGEEYHTDPAQFENDRRRDALLSAKGFRTLRFSFKQVMYCWETVRAAILAAVARGDAY
jgi:very-short-patch-repair endonuclease